MILRRIRWDMILSWVVYPLLAFAIFFIVAALAGSVLWGCHPFRVKPPDFAGHIPTPPPANVEVFGNVGIIAWVCIAIGAALLVAGFIPVAGAFVPKKAAAAALACGVGLYVLQGVLSRLLGPLVWLTGGLLAVAAIPLAIMVYRWSMDRLGKRLIGDHPDAGVALISVARGLVGDKHKEKRRALLASATKGAVA